MAVDKGVGAVIKKAKKSSKAKKAVAAGGVLKKTMGKSPRAKKVYLKGK